MIDELEALPDPDGGAGSLLETHRPDRPAPGQQDDGHRSSPSGPGCRADQLYFNIEQVGNASAASIPLAIHDAVRDGVIDRPMRIFAPGFGAGAVAGYAVLRLDPAVVAVQGAGPPAGSGAAVPTGPGEGTSTASDDVQQAFG